MIIITGAKNFTTKAKICVFIFFLASFILILGNIYRIVSTTAPDFGVLWISAKDLVIGKNPYINPALVVPNAYPPVSELFYIPLAFLPYQVSQAIFIFISFFSIVGAIYLSIKLTFGKVIWPYFLVFMGFAFLSFPTKFSLGMGQINPIVLFLSLFAYYLELKNKSVWGGIILGFSIMLKPIFVFFLLFFAFKKSWKILLVSLATVFTGIVTTLFFSNPDIWVSWINTGILPLANLAGREAYCNQGVLGFISRIFTNIDVRKYLSGFVSVLLVAFASFYAYKKKGNTLALSLFIITLLFIDTASWQHHFVWLIFPFIVLFSYVVKFKKTVFLELICLAYLLASWNFKNPSDFPSIILNNQFYGTLILWALNIYLLYRSRQKEILKTSTIYSKIK